ncbi:MAG: DJ-1 family glyoxalase III [Clostridia bacterium]
MIYCFLADGFEELEAVAPVDLLRRVDDVNVKLVSVGENEFVTSSHGFTIKCNQMIKDITLEQTLEAIILPGGMPGTLNLEKSQDVQNAIDFCVKNEKLICAICAAPSILGHKNLLEGREAICFPGFESELIGAKISESAVVKSANIITAKGAGVAVDFGLEIIKALKSEAVSKKIKEMIMCQ